MRNSIPLICLLASLALLASCISQPMSFADRLSRQVMFTIPHGKMSADPFSGGVTDGATRDSDEDQRWLGKFISFHRLKLVSRWSMKALGLDAIVAEVRGDRSVGDVVKALSEDDRIDSVQPVVTYDLLSTSAYNDPYFHLQNATVRGADIEKVHHLATGRGVVVAIVDTGMDRQHPDLVDRIVVSHNFVDQDPDRFDQDEHGTTVAGIIAATANNDLGIVGIAPEVKLIALKACWQDQKTRKSSCDSYSVLKALVEVLKLEPDILNLSLAGPPDPTIARLLTAASDKGIIIVAAVDPSRKVSFPASMPQVVAVSTSLEPGEMMPANAVLAPGVDVLTMTPGATYAFRSGSSMATAYVSGVAALVREGQRRLSGEQFRTQLIASSQQSINRIPVVDICHAVLDAARPGDCPTDVFVAAEHGAR